MGKITGLAAAEPVMPWRATQRTRPAIAAAAIIPAGS
jgi:hypothetical protein